MTPGLKWGLALGGLGVGALVAIAASSKSSATPAAPPAPVPPAGSTVWVRTTSIPVGRVGRISLPAAAMALIAQTHPGVVTADLAGLQKVLSLVTSGIAHVWAPSSQGGEALPADWPADDVAAATEYHAQFQVVAGSPFVLPSDPSGSPGTATLPIPGLIGWIPKGTGA
jgi:hypothetical protein